MAMEEQRERERIFSRLISQVITEARDNFSIEEIKDFFANSINSTRLLSKVSTLREVLNLLQKRDLLCWNKIKPLQSLGQLLHNERIEDIVRCYKKTCLEEDPDDIACVVCGFSEVQLSAPAPLNEHRANREDGVMNTRNHNYVDSLDEALENVALSIGPEWCVLARALNLIEIQIETCYESHPKNCVAQARMALKIWRQEAEENASIERLDRALEDRHCKRKGIGVHLKKPIIGVNC